MTPEHQRDLEGRLLALAKAGYCNGQPLVATWEALHDAERWADITEDLLRFYAVVFIEGVGEVGSVHAGHSQVTRHNALSGTGPDSGRKQ